MAYKVKAEDGSHVVVRGQSLVGQDNLSAQLREFDDRNRSFLAVASTGDVDRMGDRIDQSGWVLENFKNNPVCPWCHRLDDVPIARSLETFVEGDKLYFRPQFADFEKADVVWNLYKKSFLKTFSVGFLPIKTVKREKDGDEDDRPLLLSEPKDFIRQELIEISCVPVPCNVGASTSLKSLSQMGRLYVPPEYLDDDEILSIDEDDDFDFTDDEEILSLIDDEDDDDDTLLRLTDFRNRTVLRGYTSIVVRGIFKNFKNRRLLQC